MQAFNLFFVLLIAFSSVLAQYPATPYTPIVRTLHFSDARLTNQQMPPCYTVQYVASDQGAIYASNGGTIQANIFFLEFIPTTLTNPNVPLPSQTVEITLGWRSGSNGTITPLIPTYNFNTNVNGTSYSCANLGGDITYYQSQSSLNTGCGINYYCSGIGSLASVSNLQFVVTLTTSSNENAAGIVFSIRLTQRIIPVQIIQWNVPFTTPSAVTPVGESLFLPTIAQQHFYVNLSPKGTDRLSVAQFIATASGLVDVSFMLSNPLFNGANTTSQYSWVLTINEGDLAVTTIENSITLMCDSIAENQTSINSNQTIVVNIPACTLYESQVYISIGMPVGTNQPWVFTVSATYIGRSTGILTYVPSFTTITSNNTLIPDQIGDGYYDAISGDPYQQNNYWLNLNSSASDSNTYVWVTIFGISPSLAQAQIMSGNLGYLEYCANNVIDQCYNYNQAYEGTKKSTPHQVRDYCKMQITPCEYHSSAYYFVSVRGGSYNVAPFGYYSQPQNGNQITTSYSILVQLFNINPIAVGSLPLTVDNGWTEYIDINTVAELNYIHYLLVIEEGSITPFTYLISELYTNHEQTNAILYFNKDTYAGSGLSEDYYGHTTYSPVDGCFNSIKHCSTSNENFTSILGSSTCSFILQYCDILTPSSLLYFSVYGELDSGIYQDPHHSLDGFLGYNRSVSYTVKFTIRSTPELLFDGVTNIQYLPSHQISSDPILSHQFLMQVPVTSTKPIQYTYVKIHDFKHYCDKTQNLIVYYQCDNPAGPCPCFTSFSSSSGQNDIEIELSLCNCPSGLFFISVQVENPNFQCTRPSTYQITPFIVYAQVYESTTTSLISSGNNTLIITDMIYTNLEYHPYMSNFYYANYYKLVKDDTSTTTALNVFVNYAHYQLADHISYLSTFINRDIAEFGFNTPCTVDYCYGDAYDNGLTKINYQNYYQSSSLSNIQSYECSMTIKPCKFTQGTYYIGIGLFGDNKVSGSVSKQTIDYTLTIETKDWSPAVLTLNVPVHNFVMVQEHNHYQLDTTKIASNSWLRISAYLNQVTNNFVTMYMNVGSLAGDFDCYNYLAACRFGRSTDLYSIDYYSNENFYENYTNSQYCDFFFESCDIPSSTLYISIAGPETNTVTINSNKDRANQEEPVIKIEYTLVAETQSVIQLNNNYPTTGLLLYNQVQYYSFVYNSSDYRPFVIQIQSIEPYPHNFNSYIIETLISTSPVGGSPSVGSCNCNGYFYYNNFAEVIFNCGQMAPGTYYITVRNILENYFNPVSFTVRTFYHNRQTDFLTVQKFGTTILYKSPPQPLNYHESIDYNVGFANNTENVLYIGIADVSYTNTSYLNNNKNILGDVLKLKAYIYLGHPGSAGCNIDNAEIYNYETKNPNGQLMYVFQIPPCVSCNGNYYVSIYSQLQEPQPQPQFRLNFSIAAWSVPINVPAGFISSSGNFRSSAIANTQYNLPIGTGSVYCDNTYSNKPYYVDYFFQTSSLLTNIYESLQVTYSGAINELDVSINFGSGSDLRNNCGCVRSDNTPCIPPGDCVVTTNYINFVTVGISQCTKNTSIVVDGLGITWDISGSKNWTSTNSVNVPVNSTQTQSLSPRTFTYFIIDFTNYNVQLWSTFQVSAQSSSGNNDFCFNFGSTGISYPPDSYCPSSCGSIPSGTLDPCCIDTTDKYTITAYNQDSTTTITVTIQTTLTPLSLGGEAQITIPITPSVSTSSVSTTTSGLYRFFSFVLSSSIWSFDSVLNVQLFIPTSGGGGNRFMYLNYAGYAGDSSTSACFSSELQCDVNSGTCNYQVPQCGPLGYGFGTYYIGIYSDTSSTSSNLVLSIQTTSVYSSNTATGNAPEISSATNYFYTHRKFQIIRTIGDVLLSYLAPAYQVKLSTASTNTTLELSIHNPYYYSYTNILAGDSGYNPPFSGCNYHHDDNWSCPPGRTTDSNGNVACTLALCNSNNLMEQYLNQLPAGEYIYTSVRNTAINPSPVSFTLSARIVNTLNASSSVLQWTLNTINTPTDTNFTNACTTSNSGGCTYTNSAGINTVYFFIPITPSSWGVLDYLMINITNVNSGTFNIAVFPQDICEPNTNDYTSVDGSSKEYIVSYTPSTFTSTFTGDAGNNTRIAPDNRGYWLRISSISSSTTTFQVAARQVTPTTVVVNASPNLYTSVYVMWNVRYLMYNVITPATGDFNLVWTVTSSCYNTNKPAYLYIDLDNYRWSDSSIYEYTYSLDTARSGIINNCEYSNVGGNHYFTIATQDNSVVFTGTQINEGIIAPQIQITFTAYIEYANVVSISWGCLVSVPSAVGTYNYEVIGDAENYGTQVVFGFDNCPNCVLTVISPLYREALYFNTSSYNISQNYKPIPHAKSNTDYIYSGSSSGCILPDSTYPGVYVLTSTGISTLSIAIPSCEYRNGRFFVQLYSPGNPSAEIFTVINRKNINILTLSSPSYNASISSTIRPGYVLYGLVVPTNAELYLQYYKIIVPDRDSIFNFRVQIHLGSSSTLNGYLTRGDLPVPIASECQNQFTCSTNQKVKPCYLYDQLCDVYGPSITYYIGVSADSSECSVVPYTIEIDTQPSNFATIFNDIARCDEIQATNYQFLYLGYSKNPNYAIPTFVYAYQLSTTGIKMQFSTLAIYAMILNGNGTLHISTSSHPILDMNCAHCTWNVTNIASKSHSEAVNYSPLSSVTCGHSNSVYLLASTQRSNQNYVNYQIMAQVTQRTIVNVAAPVNVSFTQDSVFAFNNAQGSFVIESVTQAYAYTTLGDNVIDEDCTDYEGCPSEYNSNCKYLSQPNIYYFIKDFAPSYTTTCTSSTLNPQNFQLTTYPIIYLNSTSATNQLYSISQSQPLFFARPFSATELSTSSGFDVRISNLINGHLDIQIGCNGVADSSACTNYWIGGFKTDSQFSWASSNFGCNCDIIYITVTSTVGADCVTWDNSVSNIAQFQITVDLYSNSLSTTGSPLSSSWQPDAIQRYAQSPLLQLSSWSISSSTSGFVHVAIGNVNGTNSPSGINDPYGHNLYLSLYEIGCNTPVDWCITGLEALNDPSRDNNADYSCFVFAQSSPNTNYIATVEVMQSNPISLDYSSAFYRIQGFNTFTDLTTTNNTVFHIQGRNRHYYQVAASNSNGLQSVVITLNNLGGPRLLLEVSESINFITTQDSGYLPTDYWWEAKVCPFGECTIEISTPAQHSGASTFYVWVSPVTTNDAEQNFILEQQTNYAIYATVGTENCVSSNIFLQSSFCSTFMASGTSSFWSPRDINSLNQEASCLYESLICRCPTPTSICQASLQEFACFAVFDGCDSQGFKVPKCRTNCLNTVNVCGAFDYESASTCSCQAPQFDCGSTYYTDSNTCTGVTPTPIPTPINGGGGGGGAGGVTPDAPQSISPDCPQTILPSPTPSRSAAPGASKSAAITFSPPPSPSRSAAITFSPSSILLFFLALVMLMFAY